jgi:hypothetical protein
MNNFWDFTIGNLLTIGGGLLATAMVWQKLKDRLEMTIEQTDENKKQLEEIGRMALSTTVQQHERRIVVMEETMRVLALSIEGMKMDLMWIKDSLRRQERIVEKETQ